MGIILDTTVLIDWERGRIDVPAKIAGREQEPCFLSAISASELLHGVHRAVSDEHRVHRAAFAEAILARLPVLPIDLSIARLHAQIWSDLARTGTSVGAHDLWIAASCLATRCMLATSNSRDFAKIPGLTVESW